MWVAPRDRIVSFQRSGDDFLVSGMREKLDGINPYGRATAGDEDGGISKRRWGRRGEGRRCWQADLREHGV